MDTAITGSIGLYTFEGFAPPKDIGFYSEKQTKESKIDFARQTGITSGFRSDNLEKETKESKIDDLYSSRVEPDLGKEMDGTQGGENSTVKHRNRNRIPDDILENSD
jgi:hypothetical protein